VATLVRTQRCDLCANRGEDRTPVAAGWAPCLGAGTGRSMRAAALDRAAAGSRTGAASGQPDRAAGGQPDRATGGQRDRTTGGQRAPDRAASGQPDRAAGA